MVIEMVKFIVSWIDDFPVNGGVSTTISTKVIINGTMLDFKRYWKVEFGA